MADTFETTCDVLKVDSNLGLVIGWGIICSKGGLPYRDLDGERITPVEMLKAATEFSESAVRPSDEMHDEQQDGTVVHSFPLTDDIAKAFGITFEKADDPDQVTEGWMIAMKPSADVLAKFEDGTYTGFSIGGKAGWEHDDVEAVAS